MKWHWPTEEGWFMIVMLTLIAGVTGGLLGALVMFGFFATVNILGNWMLP